MDILRRAARSRSTRWVVSGAVSGKGLAYLATRETAFRDFSPSDDNLFNSPLYSRVNPHGNTTLHDLCVRRVDVSRIRPELVEDARNGGSGLVEEFCRGMWSGLVFAPQRGIMQIFAQRGRLKTELWTREEIQQGDIAPGTRIGGEFEVISTDATSIVLRGGQPSAVPQEQKASDGQGADLRDVDVLAELAVEVDNETATVEFRFKGIFFCGTGTGSKPPLPAFLDPLHRLYASALLREGSQWCLE